MKGGPKVVSIAAGDHRARFETRRNELVEAHLSLVDGIARAVARNLPPCFALDDLIATGNLALVRAATRYRPAQHGGAPFAAFARPVVHGAIVDSVRRRRWTDATHEVLDATHAVAIMPCAADDAINTIDAARLADRLIEAIAWLPRAQQRAVRLYYGADEPTHAEVGARMACTSRRARALHAAGIEGLRERFRRAA